VRQNGLQLRPDGEDGSGQDVVSLPAQTDFAAQAQGHVLAVAAPRKEKNTFHSCWILHENGRAEITI